MPTKAVKKKDSSAVKISKTIFIGSFLLDRNVKFTAQRLGITRATCHNYLNDPKVLEEIEQRCNDISEQCELSVEMVLNELKRIAFYDAKEHIKNINGNPTDGDFGITLEEFDKMDGRAIAEVSEKIDKESGVPLVKIKVHSKMEALKALADWYKGGHGEHNTQINININELHGKSAAEVANEYQNMIEGHSEE